MPTPEGLCTRAFLAAILFIYLQMCKFLIYKNLNLYNLK